LPNELITLDELKERLNYSPETGIFTYAKSGAGYSKFPVGTPAGCTDPRGYMLIRMNYRMYYMHRLAIFYMTGEWPPHEVDHIDGIRSNNAWSNLRLATRSEQMQNQGISKRNKSGYQGVSWSQFGKWVAMITIDGKRKNLGYFVNASDASEAYKAAKVAHKFSPNPAIRKALPYKNR